MAVELGDLLAAGDVPDEDGGFVYGTGGEPEVVVVLAGWGKGEGVDVVDVAVECLDDVAGLRVVDDNFRSEGDGDEGAVRGGGGGADVAEGDVSGFGEAGDGVWRESGGIR